MGLMHDSGFAKGLAKSPWQGRLTQLLGSPASQMGRWPSAKTVTAAMCDMTRCCVGEVLLPGPALQLPQHQARACCQQTAVPSLPPVRNEPAIAPVTSSQLGVMCCRLGSIGLISSACITHWAVNDGWMMLAASAGGSGVCRGVFEEACAASQAAFMPCIITVCHSCYNEYRML